MKKPISALQAWLTVISVSCFLVSNIITAKQMVLPFGITMTCAVFVFPITYILSDVFSEVYGYKWSRTTCQMAFLMNVAMVMFFLIAIKTKAPDYWKNQEAFETVLGSTPRILAASLLAFYVGDLVNDKIFQKLKEGNGKFLTRAIVSSFFGELTDSIIFIPLAFLGEMPIKAMTIMMLVQVTLKVLYEIIVSPLTVLAVRSIKRTEERLNA